MLSQRTADEVKRLLKTDMAMHAISRETGVSRSTIANVKSGRWDAGQRRKQKRAGLDNNEYLYPSLEGGPTERCSECGGLVYIPCHLCWVRKQIADEAKRKQS